MNRLTNIKLFLQSDWFQERNFRTFFAHATILSRKDIDLSETFKRCYTFSIVLSEVCGGFVSELVFVCTNIRLVERFCLQKRFNFTAAF